MLLRAQDLHSGYGEMEILHGVSMTLDKGEIVIAFVVAKQTHAPNCVGLFENGVIRTQPAPELIYTMADPPNLLHATQCLDMMGVMSLLQSGRVDLGFLGAAEADRFMRAIWCRDLRRTGLSFRAIGEQVGLSGGQVRRRLLMA